MPENEIEMFAAVAHLAMAGLHAEAAITGKMKPSRRGAAVTLHLLSLIYNGMRPDNRDDVAKHVAALAALALCPHDRTANVLAAIYDAHAGIWTHGRRLR